MDIARVRSRNRPHANRFQWWGGACLNDDGTGHSQRASIRIVFVTRVSDRAVYTTARGGAVNICVHLTTRNRIEQLARPRVTHTYCRTTATDRNNNNGNYIILPPVRAVMIFGDHLNRNIKIVACGKSHSSCTDVRTFPRRLHGTAKPRSLGPRTRSDINY